MNTILQGKVRMRLEDEATCRGLQRLMTQDDGYIRLTWRFTHALNTTLKYSRLLL